MADADRLEPVMGDIVALRRQLQQSPLFRSLVPMGGALSWPWPVLKRGEDGDVAVYVSFPVSARIPRPDHRTDLFAPFATITVSWPAGQIVAYQNLQFAGTFPRSTWDRPVGVFPDPEVASRPPEAYLADVRGAWTGYDQLLSSLALRRTPPPDWDRSFTAVLARVIEPSLLPFLRTLAGAAFRDRYLGADDG